MSRTCRPSSVPVSRWLHTLLSLALLAAIAAPVAGQDFQFLEVSSEAAPAAKSEDRLSGGKVRILKAPPAGLVPLDMAFVSEVEPNGTFGTATPVAGASAVVRANVFPIADVDFFSFQAAAGDRIYAATQTLSDASASGNSTLDLFASDGTTVIETDLDDGTFTATSSTIAGATIPSTGTYFLRVVQSSPTATIRPYHLHLQVQSTAATPEVEPNNTPATANPLPANGRMTGTITAVSPGESDFFSITLAAGDSVYLGLDMNPERDAAVWNGRLGFGLFGTAPANQIVLANDANSGAATPNSEALFWTVRDAGTYFVYIDSIVAAGLGPTATYELSVTVRPAAPEPANCTTYTSTDVPVVIPAGPGQVQSTLVVPGNPRIADMDVAIEIDHTFMQDLDVNLVSPAGNDNGLFSDIGAATVGGAQTTMRMTFDDEAALPPAFTLSASFNVIPELAYRLHWYDGEDAGGTWTLVIRDDAAGDSGNLTAWSLRICEPDPVPTCGPGTIPTTVYTSDFEADDGGFTHSGVQDEWERGLPSFIPITTCNSGTNCWKTDLDNTYNASASQDLLSPNIDLTGLSGPVVVNWSQRYHVESATFDHWNVTAREVGNPTNALNLFEFLDATMNNTVGNPAATIAESAGWARFTRTIDSLAGLNTELLFHLDSDTTVQLAGAAVDDVSVTACAPGNPEITLSKTVGLVAGVCGVDETLTIEHGTPVTYCYTVENTGDITLTSHDLVDDQLGTLLDNEPITLDPGDTAQVIVDDVLLDVTTTNNATWTASDSTVETSCGAGIAIVGASGTPYPSTATLSSVGTAPTSVSVTLDDVTHTYASDMDFLLVGPGGQTLIVASDFSIADSIANVDLLLDDAGPAALPDEDPVVSGMYRPTNYLNKADDWPPPAPVPPYGNPEPDGTDTFTSLYGGVDPNGTWSLYATDAFPAGDDGSIAGWCINAVYEQFTASSSDSVTVTVLFPDIAVDPASLESFLAVGAQETQPLDITNNGTATLDWTIVESEGFGATRHVVRVPGRQEPIRAHRRNPAPEAPKVTAGTETFSRAESDGVGRRVAPERGEVPDGTVTITHSTTQNIVALNSVSCNAGGLHTDNSYIRRFDLVDFGITGAFDITQVEFGVEQAIGAGGTQPLTVNLYTWDPSDPFTFANFNPIGTANASIPDQSLTIATVPVTGTAPAGSTLVVEIFTPNGQTAGHSFFVGSNPDGQTDLSFIAAPDCGAAEPTDLAILGFPGMHIVMNVTGAGGCDGDLPWVSVDPTSGATAPAATSTVDVTFDATGLLPGSVHTGALCVESDDPDTPTVQVPLTLEVDSMPFLDGFETGDTTRWTFEVP